MKRPGFFISYPNTIRTSGRTDTIPVRSTTSISVAEGVLETALDFDNAARLVLSA